MGTRKGRRDPCPGQQLVGGLGVVAQYSGVDDETFDDVREDDLDDSERGGDDREIEIVDEKLF